MALDQDAAFRKTERRIRALPERRGELTNLAELNLASNRLMVWSCG